DGSTAQIAKLLGAPVVLVVDASHVARSAAAMVYGFARFDPQLSLAGVILNQIASERHYEVVAGPIEAETGVPVLGWLGRDDRLELPERYLGLVPTVEGQLGEGYVERLRTACLETIDLGRIETIARSAADMNSAAEDTGLFPRVPIPAAVRMGVARD